MVSKFELIMYFLKMNHCIAGHDDNAERRAAWAIIEAEDCLGPVQDKYYNFEFLAKGINVKLMYGGTCVSKEASWTELTYANFNILIEIKRQLWSNLCG